MGVKYRTYLLLRDAIKQANTLGINFVDYAMTRGMYHVGEFKDDREVERRIESHVYNEYGDMYDDAHVVWEDNVCHIYCTGPDYDYLWRVYFYVRIE